MNIVGVGNTLMGDDGIGPAAIDALSERGVPAGVQLYDAGLAVADVLSALDPAEKLIVIDALRAGGQPGSVYKTRLDDASFQEGTLSECLSLHEISVLPALGIEALTGREFRDVTVFGVEPAAVDWSRPLSPAVAGTMDKLIEQVLLDVQAASATVTAGEPSQ